MILAPTLTLNSVFARGYSYDADALAYITSVETADGALLESGVRLAIDNFVRGCKTDGIWDAIKASTILAGARTLSGALQPLVGAAPTNFNFVSGDYNRKTGLVGNGSTKYLNSNRNTNSDPQDSYSVGAWVSSAGTPSNSTQLYLGGATGVGGTSAGIALSQLFSRNRSSTFTLYGSSSAIGFLGASRNDGPTYITRHSGVNATISVLSQTPASLGTHIFAESASVNFRANARLAFYSIGESLDLALLDTRVTNLINAYTAAIP